MIVPPQLNVELVLALSSKYKLTIQGFELDFTWQACGPLILEYGYAQSKPVLFDKEVKKCEHDKFF